MNNPLLYTDPSGMSWFSDAWDWASTGVSNAWDWFWDTGENFAQHMDEIGISSGGVGINSNGNTFHWIGNSGNIYHNQLGNDYAGAVNDAINDARLTATHITVLAHSRYEYTVNKGESAIRLAQSMGFVSGHVTIYDNYVQGQHYIDAGGATVKLDAFANAYLFYANADPSGGKLKVPIIGGGASVQKGGYLIGPGNSFVSQKSGNIDMRLNANGTGRVLVTIPQLSRGIYKTQLDFGHGGQYAYGGIRGVLDKTFFKKIGGNLNLGGRILVNRAYIGKRIDRLFDNNLEKLFWWMNQGVADMEWQLNQYSNEF